MSKRHHPIMTNGRGRAIGNMEGEKTADQRDIERRADGLLTKEERINRKLERRKELVRRITVEIRAVVFTRDEADLIIYLTERQVRK